MEKTRQEELYLRRKSRAVVLDPTRKSIKPLMTKASRVDDKTGAISGIKLRALHRTHCTASSMTRWVRPGARGLL